MSDLLYSKEVLRLAAEARGAGRLSGPSVSHTLHNPACGDLVTVDLRTLNGRVAALAHDTKACVLAQASASILGAALPGHTYGELEALRTEVAAMFAGGAAPASPFAAYAALNDAAQFPGRRTCVLLPIDAALKAFEESQTREPGAERAEG